MSFGIVVSGSNASVRVCCCAGASGVGAIGSLSEAVDAVNVEVPEGRMTTDAALSVTSSFKAPCCSNGISEESGREAAIPEASAGGSTGKSRGPTTKPCSIIAELIACAIFKLTIELTLIHDTLS